MSRPSNRCRASAAATVRATCEGCRSRPADRASRPATKPRRRPASPPEWRRSTKLALRRAPAATKLRRALMPCAFAGAGRSPRRRASMTKLTAMTKATSSITQSSTTRQVAVGDRLEDQPPEARQREDILDHDRAGDEIGELQAHDGQDRHQRVGQRVTPQDGAARQALGAGGADEILVASPRAAPSASCASGSPPAPDRARRPAGSARRAPATGPLPAGKAARRREPPMHREGQDEQDREPEIGHGEADLARRHHGDVADRPSMPRGDKRPRQGEDRGDRHGHQRQRQADRQGSSRSTGRSANYRRRKCPRSPCSTPPTQVA